MSTPGQLPRGLSKDYKEQLGDLTDDGWKIARTRKGHLKLTHPDTEQFVTGSSTPSDFRSVLNLKSQCRSALRNGSIITSPGATIGEDACRDTLRSHKLALRSLNRKASAISTPVKSKKPRLNNPEDDKMQNKTANIVDIATQAASSRKAATRKVAVKKPATIADVPDVAIPLQAKTIAPAETQAVVGPANTDMRRVPSDVLDLVMGILSGEVSAFLVTPEMVGGRIAVKDGVMYLIEAGGASPIAPTKAGTTENHREVANADLGMKTSSCAPVLSGTQNMQNGIMRILRQYDEPMTARDIVTLLPEQLKSESDASTWTRVGQSCAKLMQLNLSSRKKNDKNKWVYSLIAA